MIAQETIQEAINRLVRAYSPLEIYIFGAYAKDNPGDDDDLNLLIIIESSDKKVYQRSDTAFDTLFSLKIPTNVSVFTKQEFDKLAQDVTSQTYLVIKTGKKVYARS